MRLTTTSARAIHLLGQAQHLLKSHTLKRDTVTLYITAEGISLLFPGAEGYTITVDLKT